MKLKTTDDESAGYIYAANKVDDKGTIEFVNDGNIYGKTVDVTGAVKTGRDLGIFSKEGQNYDAANLEAQRNVLLQTDTTANLITDDLTIFKSGFDTVEPTSYANKITANLLQPPVQKRNAKNYGADAELPTRPWRLWLLM